MKKQLMTVTLLSILGSPTTLADTLPEQYVYQVALFNGDDLLYRDSGFTTDSNRFSNGKNVPYFIKTCEKKGQKPSINRAVNNSIKGWATRLMFMPLL
ncbi:hypothetical protein ACP6IB_25440 [Vibrio harveyi]|uniref:hypothetical protein n=1 Tax=Vibrio harveyi TaxID=669 RepID=UPI003CF0D579